MKKLLLSTLLSVGLTTLSHNIAYSSAEDFFESATGVKTSDSIAGSILNNPTYLAEYKSISGLGVTAAYYSTRKAAGDTFDVIAGSSVAAQYATPVGAAVIGNRPIANFAIADVQNAVQAFTALGVSTQESIEGDGLLSLLTITRMNQINVITPGTITPANFAQYFNYVDYLLDPNDTGEITNPLPGFVNAGTLANVNALIALTTAASGDNLNSKPLTKPSSAAITAVKQMQVLANIGNGVSQTIANQTIVLQEGLNAIRGGYAGLNPGTIPQYIAVSYEGTPRTNAGQTICTLLWSLGGAAIPAKGGAQAVGSNFIVMDNQYGSATAPSTINQTVIAAADVPLVITSAAASSTNTDPNGVSNLFSVSNSTNNNDGFIN